MKYCAGSEEIYRKILSIFCEQYIEKKAELQRLFDTQNWNDYTVQIHALKSNALNIGSESLSTLCLQLELAGKKIRAAEAVKQNTDYIINNHKIAMEMYYKVVELSKVYLNEIV